jgi:predicted aspartyl protease
MAALTASFQSGAPIIRVAIGVSEPRQHALQAALQPVPNPQACLALLDTGASHTCVDPTILSALNLSPTGSANVLTASSGTIPHACRQFDVALVIFMDNQQMHLASLTIPVVELELMNQGFGALIGRDVLSQGLLVYDGKRGELRLSF